MKLDMDGYLRMKRGGPSREFDDWLKRVGLADKYVTELRFVGEGGAEIERLSVNTEGKPFTIDGNIAKHREPVALPEPPPASSFPFFVR